MIEWTTADGSKRSSRSREPFRVLQLETRNASSIEAALDAYVAGEPISGYRTPDGESVDACKRTVLGALPHTLIVQLKRCASAAGGLDLL